MFRFSKGDREGRFRKHSSAILALFFIQFHALNIITVGRFLKLPKDKKCQNVL